MISKQLLSSGDMSQATLTSDALELTNRTRTAIQAVFTGAPNGTFKLQGTCDGQTWSDIANSSQAIAAAGDFLWNVSQMAYWKIRLVYTKSSGSGTLSVFSTAKG